MNTRKLLLVTLGAVVALGGAASAQSTFDQTHPRREEVNARLATQNARIHAERADGQISARKARRLHMADRHIRRQERRYAANHGGHISRAEQHRLNREENGVSRRIGA
jgi:hypothetical protein